MKVCQPSSSKSAVPSIDTFSSSSHRKEEGQDGKTSGTDVGSHVVPKGMIKIQWNVLSSLHFAWKTGLKASHIGPDGSSGSRSVRRQLVLRSRMKRSASLPCRVTVCPLISVSLSGKSSSMVTVTPPTISFTTSMALYVYHCKAVNLVTSKECGNWHPRYSLPGSHDPGLMACARKSGILYLCKSRHLQGPSPESWCSGRW